MGLRRILFALAVSSAVPLLAACPKKDAPVEPEAAAPPPVEDAGSTMLVPLEEDAGEEVDAAEAGPKRAGKAVNTNVARLKQCCAALQKQAATSPEIGAAVNQCNTTAAALGPGQSAPELGALKPLLAGKTIPAVCAGF